LSLLADATQSLVLSDNGISPLTDDRGGVLSA
jgi:hypothetical protein